MTRLGPIGAMQDDGMVIWFRNTGPAACTPTGTPRVVAASPGQPTVIATAGRMPSYGERSDVAAGGTVFEQVDVPEFCPADPGRSDRGDAVYHSLAISILGGITKKVGGLSLSFPGGMSATPLFVGKPQPTYPANPLVGLVPYLRLPATIKAGSTLHFEVDLSNPGDRPVVLSPCPVYLEHSDIPTKLLYRLDCRTVRSIPAHGQVRYEMEMAIPDAAPLGPAEVFWGLVGASTTTAQGQVLVQ